MEYSRLEYRLPSPLAIVAGVCIVALVAVAIWRINDRIAVSGYVSNETPYVVRNAAPNTQSAWQKSLIDLSSGVPETQASDDLNGLNNIGGNIIGTFATSYAAMQESGGFTPDRGDQVASSVAATLQAQVAFHTYSSADVTTDSDTSYARMLQYRADMRDALTPLLENPDYELKLYANYVESKDSSYLDKLRLTIGNYQKATNNAIRVVVPVDAVSYHVRVVNALSAFASVLDAMIQHTDDPFASAALLRTYQTNERELFDAFNAFAAYQRTKQP